MAFFMNKKKTYVGRKKVIEVMEVVQHSFFCFRYKINVIKFPKSVSRIKLNLL